MGKTHKDKLTKNSWKKNLKAEMKNKRKKLKDSQEIISQPSIANKILGNPWNHD